MDFCAQLPALLIEKRGFFGGNKFVNAYVERDKKILKKWIFALTPLRELFGARNSQF